MILLKQKLALFLITMVFALGMWGAGFLVFVAILPNSPEPPHEFTDAIVVLTGSKGRVELGFSLFNNGLSEKLFVSGVHPGVTIETLFYKHNIADCFKDKIFKTELGYSALNTAGNAEETAAWVARHNIKSIRLVTANYHMHRSLLEFSKLLPHVALIPHPLPEPHKLTAKTWRLLWNEYRKLTLLWVHHLFNRS